MVMSADVSPHDAQLAQLNGEARDRGSAPLRPRDAATLIIVDRAGTEAKLLMGRRHPRHKFMPGKFVFPGGRVEPSDRAMPVAGLLDAGVEEKLFARTVRPAQTLPRVLALAAIRETFEETGLLIGTREYGAPDAPVGSPWEAFASHGVFPSLEGVRFLARAITPPGRPRRFDTRFFVAEATDIAHRVEGMVGPDSELIDLDWVTLAETAAMDLPVITRVILEELEPALRDGFGPGRSVPFFHEKRRRFVKEAL